MRTTRTKIGLLALSTVLSAVAAWLVYRHFDGRPPAATVRFFRPDESDIAAVQPKSGAGKRPRVLAASIPEEWTYYVPEKLANKLMQIEAGKNEYDPWTCTRELPDRQFELSWPEHPSGRIVMRTNHIGLREDGEIPVPAPDVRVLVAGDSHTYGVCENSESFPNRLEALLRASMPGRSVEVLNAAVAGYSFYNYFGTLLRFRSFEPQVFVVAVYGGNDFGELLYTHHALNGTRPKGRTKKASALRDAAAKAAANAMGQCYSQLHFLSVAPKEQHELALSVALQLCTEMQTVCSERGIAMVVCLLPSPCDLPHHRAREEVERARHVLTLTAEQESGTRRLSAAFVDALTATGITVVDMRARFEAEPEAPYWESDLHLDLTGHRLVAEALAPVVEAALE